MTSLDDEHSGGHHHVLDYPMRARVRMLKTIGFLHEGRHNVTAGETVELDWMFVGLDKSNTVILAR